MEEKNDLIQLGRAFILGQILVLFIALLVLFIIMALSYKDKVLHILMSRLETSTETMASQLKANQVPFSAGSVERGVFIVKQTDGSMVVDRHNDAESDQKLWERHRTKLIYEMQKQKRGWIVYPDRVPWQPSQQQKIIRYLSVDELNWILAIEAIRPTDMALMKESVNPSIVLAICVVLFLGSGCLWFMTKKYSETTKKFASDTVENSLMALSGEEKMWSEGVAKESAAADLQLEPLKPALPIRSAAVHAQVPEPLPSIPLEEKASVVPAPEKTGSNDLAINVHNVKSSVLKKMIQKFRDK